MNALLIVTGPAKKQGIKFDYFSNLYGPAANQLWPGVIKHLMDCIVQSTDLFNSKCCDLN